MLPIALKGLLARKLRTALTGFAVVLGVAFVVGTFVFTDTIDASFKDLFERTQKGVDVSVQARKPVDDDFTLAPLLPSDTLDRIAAVEGVDAAAGQFEGSATLLDAEGDPIVSNAGPTLLFSTVEDRFEAVEYAEGDAPDTPGEVAIARAVVARPAIVFADEPTGNLDSKSSEEVLALLRHAVDDFGQTVIMVTHDEQAASVADRIVVLRDGQVVEDNLMRAAA